jgi:O-antigen/teichoic acid export membrane protein
MLPKRRSRFASNVVTSVATNAGRGLLGFASGIIVSRALGPQGRGEFTLVTSSALVLVMLAAAGMPSALTQARAKAARTIAELYSSSILVGAAGGIIAIGLASAWYFAAGNRALRIAQPRDLIWVVVATPTLLVLNHWTVVAYLEDRIKELGIASMIGALFFLVGAAIGKVTETLTPSTAIALWALGSMLPLAVMFRPRRIQFSAGLRAVALGLVGFSLRANIVTLALILVWRLDVFLVDWQRGLRELGLYSVAVALGEVLLQVGVSARIALTPLQGSPDEREELVGRICRLIRVLLAGLSLAALLIALLSGILVRVAYGPAFSDSAPALVWILPGVVALVLQGPVLDYLVVEGRVRAVTAICVLGLAVNVAINLAFLPHHSFVVAAVASTVAYTLSCGLCFSLFTRQTGASFKQLLMVGRTDFAAVGALSRGLLLRVR